MTNSSQAFTHLRCHSDYGLKGSIIRISEMIQKAQSCGMNSLALTDQNLFGALEFYQKCRATEVKPILGYEALLPTEFTSRN